MQERRAVAVSVLCLENVFNDLEYLVLYYGREKKPQRTMLTSISSSVRLQLSLCSHDINPQLCHWGDFRNLNVVVNFVRYSNTIAQPNVVL